MLLSLHIENIAVIKNQDIDFLDGFTVMTGETGAGKSIIIDSLALLLGAKADKELIRTGESSAMVSGVFTNPTKALFKLFEECGIAVDESGDLLIQRHISADGKSQIKINGRSVTLSVLRQIAPALVNIHGQSDTLHLTEPGAQLDLIDVYSGKKENLQKYREAYDKYIAVKENLSEMRRKEAERVRLSEILEYQINEIDELKLHPGEEDELIDKKLKIKNSEKISKNVGFAFKAIKGSEKGAAIYLIDRSISALSAISDVISDAEEYCEQLRDIKYKLDEIAENVNAELDDIEVEPEKEINRIESRLDKISKLKRKYGPTVEAILEFRDKSFDELELYRNADSIIEKLMKEEDELYKQCKAIADDIHNARCASAASIESEVKETLEFLDMPKVVFFTSITSEKEDGKLKLTPTGYDIIEFYISANAGADAQPISKIASGGELARIMLALKSAIADKDGISTVVFDEIDSGVSGKTARKIGIKMLSISKKLQVLCITHSAQIASLADTHLLIKKQEINKKTETRINALDREGRILELSRILGGINITEAQRTAAIDMLNERESYIS